MSSCNTETPDPEDKHPGGRPRKAGRSILITLRLREGEDDEILVRLARIRKGGRSAYIRRVLAGAPVEVLDQAVVETERVGTLLDSMWDDGDGNEW